MSKKSEEIIDLVTIGLLGVVAGMAIAEMINESKGGDRKKSQTRIVESRPPGWEGPEPTVGVFGIF